MNIVTSEPERKHRMKKKMAQVKNHDEDFDSEEEFDAEAELRNMFPDGMDDGFDIDSLDND